MKTKIEWATDVWNPVTGCTKVSDLESAIRVKGQEVDFWKKYALQANNLMIELKRIADKEGNIRNDQKPI